MRRILLWVMLLTASAAQADERLYGTWHGKSPATESEPEGEITLSLEETGSFSLLMISRGSEDEMASFWQDFDVEGPAFHTLTIDINGVFYVRADSLILDIHDFYMYVETTEETTHDVFDLLVEVMIASAIKEAEEAGEDSEEMRAIMEELIPPLIDLMRLGMPETLNEEFRGLYTLDGDTLYLWDDLTLYRKGSGPPTAVEAIGWGQLKSRF